MGCFFEVATERRDPAICEKITDEPRRVYCLRSIPGSAQWKRDVVQLSIPLLPFIGLILVMMVVSRRRQWWILGTLGALAAGFVIGPASASPFNPLTWPTFLFQAYELAAMKALFGRESTDSLTDLLRYIQALGIFTVSWGGFVGAWHEGGWFRKIATALFLANVAYSIFLIILFFLAFRGAP